MFHEAAVVLKPFTAEAALKWTSGCMGGFLMLSIKQKI